MRVNRFEYETWLKDAADKGYSTFAAYIRAVLSGREIIIDKFVQNYEFLKTIESGKRG